MAWSRPATMGKWTWGDESAKTKAEIEQQIAEHLCEVLCDGDCGSVIGPDENTHNIHVCATVMVNDRMPPSANAKAKRRIQQLERCLMTVYWELHGRHRDLWSMGMEDTDPDDEELRLVSKLRGRIQRTIDPFKHVRIKKPAVT